MPKSDIGQQYRNTFVRSNHVVVVLSYYYRIIFYIYTSPLLHLGMAPKSYEWTYGPVHFTVISWDWE